MYRTAVKRLDLIRSTLLNSSNGRFRLPLPIQTVTGSSRSCTNPAKPSFSYQNENPQTQSSGFPDSSSTTSSSTQSASSTAQDVPRRENTSSSRARFQDEQARLLQASLTHVMILGWTEAALISGARDVGLSPSIIGSLPRKEGQLVEFFMDDCLKRLIDIIDSNEEFKNFTPSERISKLVKIRLQMQAPYISKWPQALSIQAQPANVASSFRQRAMLVDEIWHAAGDDASDIDWYVKRTILGGIYSATELYMLTDASPDFRDTWTFLDSRVRDAFDFKKTIQEASYLAETVGAGIGGSVQGFVNKIFGDDRKSKMF